MDVRAVADADAFGQRARYGEAMAGDEADVAYAAGRVRAGVTRRGGGGWVTGQREVKRLRRHYARCGGHGRTLALKILKSIAADGEGARDETARRRTCHRAAGAAAAAEPGEGSLTRCDRAAQLHGGRAGGAHSGGRRGTSPDSTRRCRYQRSDAPAPPRHALALSSKPHVLAAPELADEVAAEAGDPSAGLEPRPRRAAAPSRRSKTRLSSRARRPTYLVRRRSASAGAAALRRHFEAATDGSGRYRCALKHSWHVRRSRARAPPSAATADGSGVARASTRTSSNTLPRPARRRRTSSNQSRKIVIPPRR